MGTGRQSIRPFSRHTRNNRGGPPTRTSGIRVPISRRLTPRVNKHSRVIVTTHPNIVSQSIKQVNASQARRNKRETRRKRMVIKPGEWNDIYELINYPEIEENIGIAINKETNRLYGTEGKITPGQFNQLIEELEESLVTKDDPNYDAYEQLILKKAIHFVRKEAASVSHNVDELANMFANQRL